MPRTEHLHEETSSDHVLGFRGSGASSPITDASGEEGKMSDLHKSFAKSHLTRLPPEPPPIFDERDEDEAGEETNSMPMESPNDSSSSASSTGTIIASPGKKLFERSKDTNGTKCRLSPLPWTDFFHQELDFVREVDGHVITHHAYLNPPQHTGPLFITHHGAGSSGLSFAAFTIELQKVLPTAGVLSLDARGHGRTTTQSSDPSLDSEPTPDLSLPTLSADLAYVVQSTQTQLGWPTLPPLLLVGHSLGGAVVTDVAHQQLLGPTLLGYGVLDVVEGSALSVLRSMESYLASRPASFSSLPTAIDWHVRSRTIRNISSARVSVPPLLIPSPAPLLSSDTLHPTPETLTWRTPLSPTAPLWSSWFTSLSSKFLSARGAKLLLLAGTDRLDKELTIGQMQGKYQLAIFPDSGHFVHEDQPERTALVIAEFYQRNDRSAFVIPKKVDELIREGKLGKGKGT